MSETLAALRRGDLAGARELRLTGLGLTELPDDVFGLADTLEVLDLSGNALSRLPDGMGRLSALRAVFCSGNRFERLPPSLGDCPALGQIGFRAAGVRDVPGEALPPRLRWLTLTDNGIARLPDALGERPLLQKLMLAGNRLQTLPDTMAGADNLELIRLASNDLTALPSWLAELPRLAWIAWGGNPVEPAMPSAEATRVSWAKLELGEILGEGASGRIHRALWRPETGAVRPVALKLFKGAMTSDGLPEREMDACLGAGAHPNLTAGLGRLIEHPDGVDGLLMPLLPAHWGALARPPSLASCSRDVYASDLRLDEAVALNLASAAAAATAHLHANRLLHGDLYGHNILWRRDASDAGTGTSEGIALLGDFGAASFIADGSDAAALERIEVRAFGCLLEELIERCDADAGAVPALTAMRMLQARCLRGDAAMRPGFAAIDAALRALRIG